MQALNNLIVKFVQMMPKKLVRVFAGKYIAGDTIDDAVALVKKFNARGILATMDVLGESVSTREEAIAAQKQCLDVLDRIKSENLQSNLSIKPTQMGLLLDEEFCYQQVKELVEKAREYNNFVRLDMEDSDTTNRIIHLYKRLRQDYENVGIVLQSYMRRTVDDVKDLNALNTNYRLCKGIYIEPEAVAYKGRTEVRDSYIRALYLMFKNDSYVGIATHDEYLIERSKEMVTSMKVQKDRYEFQMLLGVREDIRDDINQSGHRIRIYVPFGKDWYKYSIRRLKENPQVAWHIFKNVFGIK